MTRGQRLAKLRNSRGLSQPQFAEILNVSQSTVAMWESGKRNISNDDLVRIAQFFHVTTDYILGNNETPKWAKQKDTIDLKSFLDKNLVGAFYDGDELTEEQKDKLQIALTQIFWDQRKKERSDTDDSNKKTK
ncbi:helix-turn-helix domain-containing protein [Companilactobacillus nantensis]|uniref:HTH cro/C1-type domain-containing protein n=1 Tax=Companilactobacillus nantensis DSM 16982 TaxID=1423774 RepID=A0A0R1WHR6_9LACO|nr:helix-turn-helix transcriptional regulator [Companilactobacillus nantensis]KRM17295.1 hypothetical protein FD31_GL000374 [Companilactobacillus nantensis DSM 16982]GEO63973.1 transcriptional regulator [Companilactobacillus nantensis]